MSSASPEGAPRASQSGAPTSPHPAKDALRAAVRAARAADPGREAADAARLPRLLEVSRGHATVACYFSVPPEPDTTALVEALADAGVRVLLPVLKGHRTPAWGWYDGPGSLVPGWRGIPEPGGDALAPDALAACSLVWVSALRATPAGYRLGTGGGWYDRALLRARPDAVRATLVGDSELVDALPRDPWDLPVDLVVTPTDTIATGARGVPWPPEAEQPRQHAR